MQDRKDRKPIVIRAQHSHILVGEQIYIFSRRETTRKPLGQADERLFFNLYPYLTINSFLSETGVS